ncbi:MAG: type II-A CRISPR-associated protein Csn2 [Fusobacteriaceae bacterium]
MIIKLLYFENDVEILPDKISILEIENKKMFSKFIYSIYNKINGIDTGDEIYLFENGKEVKFSEKALYISDPMMIDFNSKDIISTVTKLVSKQLNIDIDIKNICEQKYSELYSLFQNILSDFTINFDSSSQFDITKFIKMIGLKIDDSLNSNHLEKILSIIEIISELQLNKFIIFCNLKSYLLEEELKEVYKFSLYKKIPLILFESSLDKNYFEHEKKLTIDNDYDEFVKKI